MPIETRHIEFSDDELIDAVLEYCREARIAVPAADVENLQVGSDPERLVRLTFAVHSPVEPDEIVLSSQQILSALVQFCRLNHIPLPAEAVKRITSENGTLAMSFHTERRSRLKNGVAA